MEKGYRDYGHDIDNTDSPLEAGLGFALDLKKPGGFLGKEAVMAKKAEGPLKRRIAQILVKDPEALLYHAEVVRRNGKAVGYVRAGSYGFTVGGAVGLAMLEAGEPLAQAWVARGTGGGGVGLAMVGGGEPLAQAWLDDGTWEVEIAGKSYPAMPSLKPLYDP